VAAVALTDGIKASVITERTGLPQSSCYKRLKKLVKKGTLVKQGDLYIVPKDTTKEVARGKG